MKPIFKNYFQTISQILKAKAPLWFADIKTLKLTVLRHYQNLFYQQPTSWLTCSRGLVSLMYNPVSRHFLKEWQDVFYRICVHEYIQVSHVHIHEILWDKCHQYFTNYFFDAMILCCNVASLLTLLFSLLAWCKWRNGINQMWCQTYCIQ